MGRPDFSAAGTSGGGQHVMVHRRPELQHQTATNTTSLAAGNTETVQFFAPTGAVWRPAVMWLNAPADATWTSGSHGFKIQTAGNVPAIEGRNDYTNNVKWSSNTWVSANSRQRPSGETAQVLSLQNLIATENQAINVIYDNSGNAAQDNSREYEFTFKEESY